MVLVRSITESLSLFATYTRASSALAKVITHTLDHVRHQTNVSMQVIHISIRFLKKLRKGGENIYNFCFAGTKGVMHKHVDRLYVLARHSAQPFSMLALHPHRLATPCNTFYNIINLTIFNEKLCSMLAISAVPLHGTTCRLTCAPSSEQQRLDAFLSECRSRATLLTPKKNCFFFIIYN